MSLSRPRKYRKRDHPPPASDCCCVPHCSVTERFSSAVSFHRFPEDDNTRRRWIRNVYQQRADLLTDLLSDTTVCSRHFRPSDVIEGGRRRLRDDAVPVLFAWNNYSLPEDDDELITGEEEEMDGGVPLRCRDDDYDYDDAEPEPSALGAAREQLAAQQGVIEELQRRLAEATLKQSFGLERFLASDDDIRFYTRFSSYRHLEAFWKQIEPAAMRLIATPSSTSSTAAAAAPHRASRCLPMFDELFLFLVYLSLGLKEKDLGDRFNIHQSTVSTIIQTWVDFLYTLLGAVEIWMSPEAVRATMPSVFDNYSDTQVLIDCIEMRCQMPSSLLLQSEIFSEYESHTTLKGMIGVSPHGAVTFVSSLYSGSISDSELFRQSGIVPLLDKDMAVMVDKGFRIDEPPPCRVYRPPFLSKKSDLPHDDMLVTQDIDRLRTIRRIKENKLFDTVIPLTIAGSINQLFVVACLLTNYQNKPLVKDWAKELTLTPFPSTQT